MDFLDKTLPLSILFIMPGFLFNKIRSMAIAKHTDTEKGALMAAIATSALLSIPVLPFAYYFKSDIIYVYSHPSAKAGIIVFALLFLWPCFSSLVSLRASKWQRWRKIRDYFFINASAPRSWDYFFNQKRHSMLKITLKDGSQIRGYFGSYSFASSYPANGDLYVQEEYEETKDENNVKKLNRIDRTAGFWVDMLEVRCVQFTSIPEEGQQAQIEVVTMPVIDESPVSDNVDQKSKQEYTNGQEQSATSESSA